MAVLVQATGMDVAIELVRLLNLDTNFASTFNPDLVGTDDPGIVSLDENTRCAVILAGEGDRIATDNTYVEVAYIVVMNYLYDKNRSSAKKSELARLSKLIRDIIRKYPTHNSQSGYQMWYLLKFKDPATIYSSGASFRLSTTYIEVFMRKRITLDYDNQTQQQNIVDPYG